MIFSWFIIPTAVSPVRMKQQIKHFQMNSGDPQGLQDHGITFQGHCQKRVVQPSGWEWAIWHFWRNVSLLCPPGRNHYHTRKWGRQLLHYWPGEFLTKPVWCCLFQFDNVKHCYRFSFILFARYLSLMFFIGRGRGLRQRRESFEHWRRRKLWRTRFDLWNTQSSYSQGFDRCKAVGNW